MEELKSRQSSVIRAFRQLARESEVRMEEGVFLCDGEKLLEEALRSGAEVRCVLWREKRSEHFEPFGEEYLLPGDISSQMRIYMGRMTASSLAETSTVKSAGAVSTPSITKVSSSISRTARFASRLNEKGLRCPGATSSKMALIRWSKIVSTFMVDRRPPGPGRLRP